MWVQAEVEAMEGSADGATDALDAFMTDMKDSEAQARLQALQSAAALLDAQIEQTRHLLRIADPDGHFKEVCIYLFMQRVCVSMATE